MNVSESDWYEPAHDYTQEDLLMDYLNNEQCVALGKRMHRGHDDQPDKTVDWRAEHRRITGVFGQRHLARLLIAPWKRVENKFGWNGCPVTLEATGLGVSSNAQEPKRKGVWPELIVPWPPRVKADIWCLIVWHGLLIEPTFGGWAYRHDLEEQGRFTHLGRPDKGIDAMTMGIPQLRPFWELMALHRPDSPKAQPPPEPEPEPEPEPPAPQVKQLVLM